MLKNLRPLTYALILAGSLCAQDPAEEPLDPGFIAYREYCNSCHLDTGWGNITIDCPSIAALPRWYVSAQLRDFRSGHRGFHKEDDQGKLMTTATMPLTEKDIAYLGRYVESLTPNPNRSTTSEFDPNRGKAIYQERCLECHGEFAQGDRLSQTPPLTQQPDWYLLSQMWKFNIDARVHSTDQEIKIDVAKEAGDIAAYLASLSPKEAD